MTRDEMIYTPQATGSVRVLGPVDVDALCKSLSNFIQVAHEGVKQQGLRWAGDFEGVSDLRYSEANPNKIGEKDFVNWIE